MPHFENMIRLNMAKQIYMHGQKCFFFTWWNMLLDDQTCFTWSNTFLHVFYRFKHVYRWVKAFCMIKHFSNWSNMLEMFDMFDISRPMYMSKHVQPILSGTYSRFYPEHIGRHVWPYFIRNIWADMIIVKYSLYTILWDPIFLIIELDYWEKYFFKNQPAL